MASLRLKRKQPSDEGAVKEFASGSYYGPAGGVSGLYPPEPLQRYRRKGRKDKLSWVEHTFTPYLDGHSWRKYGEKSIKDSPFNRLYFRCSYREEKQCKALKQVQQVTFDDPPLFSVTYEHAHTCNVEPVLAPDVGVIAAEVDPPAASAGEMVLRFGFSGDGHHHCDETMQQEKQQWQQSVPPISSFLMTSLYSWNAQLQEQNPAFSSDISPLDPASSSSFPIIQSLPSPPSTDDRDGMFSTWEWDSFTYCLNDHFHQDDHVQFPGDNSGSLVSWETDGCPLARTLTGIEAKEVIF